MIYLCGPDRLKRRLLVTPVFPPLLLTSKSVFQPSLVSSLLQCAAQGVPLWFPSCPGLSVCPVWSVPIDRSRLFLPSRQPRSWDGNGVPSLPLPDYPLPTSLNDARECKCPSGMWMDPEENNKGFVLLNEVGCIAKQKGYHVSCRKRVLKAKSLMPTPTMFIGNTSPRTPIWRENRGLRRTELGERAPPVQSRRYRR